MKPYPIQTLAVLILLLAPQRAQAQEAPGAGPSVDVVADEMQPLHRMLEAAAEEGFGGAVVVERAGVVLLKAGYGMADRGVGVPFTPRTIAQVGSITKQFTAMAVIDLWRRGLLDFTDPVSAFLPQVTGPLADRTLHQLLTHTGGLPEYCGPDFERTTLDDLLACLNGSALGPVGPVSYSNPGYSVLAAVVEAVADTSLEAVLEQRFFRPLGMESTGYSFPGHPDRGLAHGYGSEGPTPPISVRIAALGDAWWALKGNGGMQASVDDMLRWSRALRRGPVITTAMRDLAFSGHETREPGIQVGYGWFVRTDEAGRVWRVSHSGSDGTFFAAALWYPRTETFIYLVGNSGESNVRPIVSRVLELVAPRQTP